jgi:hypothetical protein
MQEIFVGGHLTTNNQSIIQPPVILSLVINNVCAFLLYY